MLLSETFRQRPMFRSATCWWLSSLPIVAAGTNEAGEAYVVVQHSRHGGSRK
jgi:hypothetical protein